jgi:SPP1 family predicted phage head-tail adaptor
VATMRLDKIIQLFDYVETKNENGFPIKVKTREKTVFANKGSLRSMEFYAATQSGFSREKMQFTILTLEYDSHNFVEYNSKTYQIIRSYEKGKYIELICHAYQERL